jgi:hypothetical protein
VAGFQVPITGWFSLPADMIRIPLKKERRHKNDNLIAKREEENKKQIIEERFYRVKSLLTEGKVEFQLAEYNEPNIPKGRTPDAPTQRLLDIYELSSSTEEDLVWLLEFTTGKKIELPAPMVETTPVNQTVPPDSLL